jgi:ribosomal protein L24E
MQGSTFFFCSEKESSKENAAAGKTGRKLTLTR